MRRQTLFLLFMILFSLPLTVLAQGTKTVKGTVVDQNNEPIIGATVVVKGSTIGAATDLDGNYVLNGVPEDATLVFNYLGMLPQEISAAGQSVINVKLREDAQLLEEVVVIGYGSAKATLSKRKNLSMFLPPPRWQHCRERYRVLTSSIRERRAKVLK